jgi:heme/copper-type cytochrome/quinol oxidase subunit 1
MLLKVQYKTSATMIIAVPTGIKMIFLFSLLWCINFK